MRKLTQYAWQTGELLKVGGWFRIRHPEGPKHYFAHNETHVARSIRQEVVKANPDMPDLQLGVMVEFTITDFHGQLCRHMVPIEWCQPCPRPSVARRVASARFPRTTDVAADPPQPKQGVLDLSVRAPSERTSL